jgi:hypothetical protein
MFAFSFLVLALFCVLVRRQELNLNHQESGKPADLMDKYGLNAVSIAEKALKAISRK